MPLVRRQSPPLRPAEVRAGLVVGVAAVSTAAVLVRVADAPGLALAFWRCFGGAVALAPFAVRALRGGVRVDGPQRRRLAASGLFLGAHFGLWISSLSFTTVASSSVLVSMSPLFVGLGAALFLGEPPSRRTWAGIGLAAAGAVAIGAADLAGAPLGGRALLGDAMAFAGAAVIAGYLLIGRASRSRLPVSVYAAMVYGFAAAALLAVCAVAGVPLWGYDGRTWLAIAGLIVGPQLLGHTVFNHLLSALPATTVAVVVLAEPLGAGLLAWMLLAELPTPGFALGAPLVLAGVFLAAAGGRPVRAVDPR